MGDFSFSLGGLIPLWLLCVPLVVGLISLVSTPHRSHNPGRGAGDTRVPQASRHPASTSGVGVQRL